MFSKPIHCALIATLLLICASVTLGQDDKKVLGEVTVHADDPIYKELRGLSSAQDAFSGDYATVSNVVLQQDIGTFTLKSGAVYFLKPAEGRVTGAVFIGAGEFQLTPPTPTEDRRVEAIILARRSILVYYDAGTHLFRASRLALSRVRPELRSL